MPTQADSLLASVSRPATVRRRPDLEGVPQEYQGRRYWVVKEPIGLNYFRFEEEEYALLGLLDGQRSLEAIQAEFEARFPPQKISLARLQQFIGMLHRSGLVIAETAGQGARLYERRRERLARERRAALASFFAWRFKGFDPDRLLSWLTPRAGWLFSRPAVMAAMALALAALTLVGVRFEAFQAKLPSFQSFFDVQNWLLLALVLAGVKVLHEFGHALACKRLGGECHEMGVMLLMFTPCLYVNVSDSWMVPSKWRRAAIGAAGMYVELILASIATFLWWFSQPGLIHYLALSTMFVCSVSTLLFNGNPLLRYDGYYILCDLLEIPNLRQKATTLLTSKLAAWCLGLEESADPFLPRRHRVVFALYAVAAAIYRWIVTFSILWFFYKLFEPYRLEIIGNLIGLAALYGLVVRPLWKVVQFFHVPGRLYKVKRARMYATLAGLATTTAFVCWVPLPSRTYGTLELETRDVTNVYVDVPGRLSAIAARAGDHVEAGATLARLENLDVRLTLAALQGDRDRHNAELTSLEHRRHTDIRAGLGIDPAREAIQTLDEQLAQKEADLARLELAAPRAGTVLPPPLVPSNRSGDELPTWSGSPLEDRNLGATLLESTLLCRIGDPQAFQAVLAVDQADIEYLAAGQTVEILFDQLPGRVFTSRITEVAKRDLQASSRRLSAKAGGELATKTDAAGIERPLSTTYQALVPLDDVEGLLREGLRGRAKIHTRPMTLGSRFWRSFTRTFHFEL